MVSDRYQIVIGLEVHIQLQTNRKIFGPEGYSFEAEPNTLVSEVTLAHPGALPVVNEAAVRAAIRLGLACGCSISPELRFDRKHYFYPDLPKGYQLTQDEMPICMGGEIPFQDPDGNYQKLSLHHIHLEEDAGRSLHDQEPGLTLIDLNRAGVPLLEMVTEPGLCRPEEASAFLIQVRRLVRALGIGDGNMEKGNLRCDANVSLRYPDGNQATERVEIKNINSFQFLERALHYEIHRQKQELAKGRSVKRETRSWDAVGGITIAMRDKEQAADYRYMPEPDLPALPISREMIEIERASLPELPWDRFDRYRQAGLLPDQVEVLIEDQSYGQYLEEVALKVAPRLAANWVLGPVRSWLNAQNQSIIDFPVPAEKLGDMVSRIEKGQISHHQAKTQLFEAMLKHPEKELEELMANLKLGQAVDAGELGTAMQKLMTAHPDEVQRYRTGKKNLQGWFVGQLMRQFKGKADPREVNRVVKELLAKD